MAALLCNDFADVDGDVIVDAAGALADAGALAADVAVVDADAAMVANLAGDIDGCCYYAGLGGGRG